MSTLVPNRFLFRFEFPLLYRKPATIDGDLSDWSEKYLLPDLGPIDPEPSFGKIYMGWNEAGLYIAAKVEGRHTPFQCDPKQFWKGDNLRLMIDTCDARHQAGLTFLPEVLFFAKRRWERW